MNVEYFKEEFTKFISRFGGPININDEILAPLSNQEILDAINDVMNAKLDITLVDSCQADAKTPAAGIIVSTPDAPDIPKNDNDRKENGGFPGRFRSLDTLTSENLKNSPIEELIIPEPGQLSSKNDDKGDGSNLSLPGDARLDQKKAMSKSSPSVNTIVRSDTFVRDEEFESLTNADDVFSEKKIESAFANDDFTMLDQNFPEVLKKMENIRDSMNDVIRKCYDMKKVGANNARPIRRLSTMACFPGFNHASVTSRTSKIARRSIAAFPGTPTSSRMSPGSASKKDSPHRKSISTASLVTLSGSKLTLPPTCRSVSSGSLTMSKKSPVLANAVNQGSRLSLVKAQKAPRLRSPVLSVVHITDRVDGKVQKNPKYAHVQSTIPKQSIVLGKRKAN